MCGILVYLNFQYHSSIFQELLNKIKHRGPDNSQILIKDNIYFGFNRLAINDTSANGNQPFNLKNIIMVCNGEIFNHKELEDKYKILTESKSDCEVIIHLYKKIGFKKMVEELDGEFAIVLYDTEKRVIFAARDKYGVRPLFWARTINSVCFASEAKALPYEHHVSQFPCGHFVSSAYNYNPKSFIKTETKINFSDAYKEIKNSLYSAVQKRVKNSDRPIGVLLSGGFDSSLISAISAKYVNNLHSFSIGHKDSTDIKYANEVAKKIGTIHHNITISNEDAIRAIPEVIYSLESYDITTIRASTPMWLLSKWIKNNTDIKVLLSGEGADEYGSYLYFKYAPSNEEFDKESRRLLGDINYYDGLRADRCISAHGLELRVPFLDKDFSNTFLSAPVEYRMPYKGTEKYHLRKMFSTEDLLPPSVNWRKKDAFSDSVGSSWRLAIRDYTDKLYTNEEFEYLSNNYLYNKPMNKEALWYRELFERTYPAKPHLTPYYWMPKWVETDDPSAKTINSEEFA